jgi:proton glutamate symport protein
VFSILLGIAVGRLADGPRVHLLGFFEAGFQAMMVLTGGIIRLAPLGVFGLIANAVGTAGLAAFQALAWYAITVASGLATHLFLVLPLLLLFVGRSAPGSTSATWPSRWRWRSPPPPRPRPCR